MKYLIKNAAVLAIAWLSLITPVGVYAQALSGTDLRPRVYDPYTGFAKPYFYKYTQSDPVPWRPGEWGTHEGWVSRYLYDRPTVSPYLNLLRHDITFYSTTRYHALVVPRLEERLQQRLKETQVARGPLHFDPATGRGEVRHAARGIMSTGHPTHFMSQFAPGGLDVRSVYKDRAILPFPIYSGKTTDLRHSYPDGAASAYLSSIRRDLPSYATAKHDLFTLRYLNNVSRRRFRQDREERLEAWPQLGLDIAATPNGLR